MCVEPGPLELQALIFARTLRAFGGMYANARVVMISPRGKHFTPSIAYLLEALNCELAVEDLNNKYSDYALANKPYGAAWIASQIDSQLWFLDCDTIITADPTPLVTCLADKSDTILRCVWTGGFNGVGSYGPGDSNDALWTKAYQLCGASYEPYTWAPWAKRKIRGYWNSGVILSRDRRLYSEWLRCYNLLKGSSLNISKPYYFEQLSLAIAMATLGLSSTSFPGVNTAIEGIERVKIGELYIVHYAGPGQKKMNSRIESGELFFSKSGIIKHPNGIDIVSVIENAMIDYNQITNESKIVRTLAH